MAATALHLAARGKDGVEVLAVTNEGSFASTPALDLSERAVAQAKSVVYSRDGRLLAWATPTAAVVVDAATGDLVRELPVAKIVELAFSPQGTLLATWQRPVSEPGKEPADNLHVWRVSDGQQVLSVFQRAQTGWTPQWTDDESLMARLVTNEVHVYNGQDPSAATLATEAGTPQRIRLEGVTALWTAPGPAPHKFAAFTPERKAAPANVRIYAFGAPNAPLSQKTFFKADKVDLRWNRAVRRGCRCGVNHLGTRALVLTQTEVDTTGKSYYGETNLYFLDSQGKHDCRVVLDKEGPIHDLAWSPNSREFVVVYGFMPAKAKLFDAKAETIFDFGAASRNTALFNPQGTALCLAGFGNLAGEVEVWWRESLKRVSTIAAPDVTAMEWSPCGRYLVGATLSPRLRVDNGVRLWHYRGVALAHRPFAELFQVAWRPVDLPARPLSPVPAARPGVGPTPKAPPAPVKAAYVPPHLRNQNGTTATAAAPPRKLYDLVGEKVDVSPADQKPGDGKPLSKSALKNKKRKAKAGQAGGDVSEDEDAGAAAASTPAPSATQAPAPTPAQSGGAAADGDGETAKKIRAIQKKLKQIEQLKEQQAQGKKLEVNQLEKLKGEAALHKELEELLKL